MRVSRLTVLVLTAFVGTAWADARVNYLLHCSGCHRVDGLGLPPEVPSLVNTLGPLAATAEGRDYLARVPGAAQAPIPDAQLAEVLNWILEEYNADSLPPDFRPLSVAEISASRPRALSDPLRARAALWTPADPAKP